MKSRVIVGLILLLLCTVGNTAHAKLKTCMSLAPQYKRTLIAESRAFLGLGAPIAAFAAQIEQESSWCADITAWDNGRGLAQFMDGTTKTIVNSFPELGPGDPYNPRWAIRALVRYDEWIRKRVKGANNCEAWAAAFKGYNAGLGYVQRAQKRSEKPELWFDHTEMINAGQSAKNFEYSRMYPRWIILKRQRNYLDWGEVTCRDMLKLSPAM